MVGEVAEIEEEIDDVKLALDGINMMLNNGIQESHALFEKYKNYSPLMNAGSSFVTFMQAIMTFEDEKLAEAMKSLQKTEKQCELNEGFIKTLKRKLGRKKNEVSKISLEERYQRQIIVADSLLYQAVLTFINQDITSYMKGGWIMRKAWKIYDKVYKEIKTLYDQDPNAQSAIQQVYIMHQESATILPPEASEVELSNGDLKISPSQGSLTSTGSEAKPDMDGSDVEIEKPSGDKLARLMGAVSFGYGMFQTCVSLIPPKILKLMEFLGFEGDREVGLAAMEFASYSKDMKAPLATLGLLWYHTVMRQFFALDGTNLRAGVAEGEKIIERIQKEYPNSALFLFYKGRVQRLKGDVDSSITSYKAALSACEGERELQHICIYEIGWSNVMKMNWREAFDAFNRMKDESRWSKAYYTYLTAVCQGALGDVKGAHFNFEAVPKLVKRKNNQIEAFVQRRAEKFKKTRPTEEHVVLLALEILYLWNALPMCTQEGLKAMLEECNRVEEKKHFHLRSLVEGGIQKLLGEEEFAMVCFEEAIARHNGMKEDVHVVAFALYELGMILIQKPETVEKGKAYLLKAKDGFKDYDFENRLNVRIHVTLKRLKEEGK